MKGKAYYFLSMNNFTKEGGGTIRMYSILNALALQGHQVTFFSNAKDLSKFHENITHVPIDITLSPRDKRKFQFLLSTLGHKLLKLSFSQLYAQYKKIFKPFDVPLLYTFEYLDNSIGYWLFKNKLVQAYANDIHGVSTLEFDFQLKNNTNFAKKTLLWLKKQTAYHLDQKVLTGSCKNIYVTRAMRNYFIQLYPILQNKNYVLLNNLVPPTAQPNELTKDDAEPLRRKYNIAKNHKIILFTGAFKLTGGVIILIKAFEVVKLKHPHITLLLVGDGYEKPNCENYVAQHQIDDVIFTGRTPYHDLPYYQALSDIIVCPDTNNQFSKLVIHIKYIDALLSNRLVINGSFPSVLEINKNEQLSLLYEPSNIQALAEKLAYALENYNFLSIKYRGTAEKMIQDYSYMSQVDTL